MSELDKALKDIDELKETINRQKEKIDDLKRIVGLMNKRKYYRKFVDGVFSKQKGKELSTPDFDYIYELYFKQQAEIKRLSTLSKLGNMRANDYRVMRDRALKAEKELERLKQENELLKIEQEYEENLVELVETKAVKEFAEKFLQKAEKTTIIYIADTTIQEQETGWYQISVADFEKLLKEKVGEGIAEDS